MPEIGTPVDEGLEEENPIATELSQLNAAGDDQDIVAEIAQMDAADGGDAVPAPADPAPATAPTAPAVDPKVQEYTARIATLERQQRENDAKAEQGVATAAIARIQQELMDEEGLSPSRAKAIAEREVTSEQQLRTQVSEANSKALYAVQLASHHKMPEMVGSLLVYNTVETMTAAAEKMADEGKQAARISALESELAAMKKGQVPPQAFDSGRGAVTVPSNELSLLQQYGEGIRTPEVVAAARKAAGG